MYYRKNLMKKKNQLFWSSLKSMYIHINRPRFKDFLIMYVFSSKTFLLLKTLPLFVIVLSPQLSVLYKYAVKQSGRTDSGGKKVFLGWWYL